MPVPNQFANVTTSIPLSQLDANFNTPITLGNTAIQLGNTVSTLNNMTLANVTISSGNVTITNVSVTTANVTTANITTAIIGTANVTTANVTTGIIGTANVTTGNITTAVITTANVATANITTSQILNYGTANSVVYLNSSKAATANTGLQFDGTNLGLGVTPSAWNTGWRALTLGSLANINSTDGWLQLLANAYYDVSGNYKYIASASTRATRYLQNGGVHSWEYSAAGTAGNNITFTQAMTLDASGNWSLGVAATSGYRARIRGEGSTNATRALLVDNSAGSALLEILNDGSMNFGATTPRMVLDANGSLLLGSTSSFGSAWKIQTYNALTNDNRMQFTHTGTGNTSSDGLLVGLIQNIGYLFNYENDSLIFGTNATERARITSGGDFLIGTTTSQDPLTVTNGATINGGGLDFSTSGTKNWQVIGNATDFYIGNQTLTRYASLAGITTFTAWTFVSDRRLKHEIKDVKYGLSSLMQIKPREFKFIEDNQSSIGFIAQELKQIIPEAVMGDEIEFSENDSPEERAAKTMSVSKEMLIPVLVKAIQELNAKVESLEAQLKGNA